MIPSLLRVALRQQALCLPDAPADGPSRPVSAATLALVAELRGLGYAVSEPLLHALDALDATDRQTVLDVVNDVLGTHLNWASLVKGWLVPTGESPWDHFVTLLANVMREQGVDIEGTTLPCGHLIPDGTFPLDRYNGCPFCGQPFRTASFVYRGQGTKLKVLTLWTAADLRRHLEALLASPVPLDAMQRDSLSVLLAHRADIGADDALPPVAMKETRMLVVDSLIGQNLDDEAAQLFDAPSDVLRYLWYRHTGHVQLLRPHTLLYNARKNLRYERLSPDDAGLRLAERRAALRLHYDRLWCRRVARWLNGLSMPLDQQLETMHPQREMWVRFIRALRLYEYGRKAGYERLHLLLDRFYRRDYRVWQADVDDSLRRADGAALLVRLRQRPGLFARCLFSTMVTVGPDVVLQAFREVLPQVPTRLLLSLGAQAPLWFDRDAQRLAHPLGGVPRHLPAHSLLCRYSDEQLHQMATDVAALYLDALRQRYRRQGVAAQPHTVYIAPALYRIPVAVGDRTATLQDSDAALQGTRFDVEGDAVRLFLQWGKGLPAQHLDMDLSCYILADNRPGALLSSGVDVEQCAYFNLVVPGARHSGDIQHIPDQVGTAEYIELSLPDLQHHGARRVLFVCNAYTAGELQPGLVVGWMAASAPMTVDNDTGVAYDPSTVQHMVRISEGNLSKGLVFGVLDVQERTIMWVEMPFDGQTVRGVNPQTVDALVRRLAAKPTVGQVLAVRAEAQGHRLTTRQDEADECYTPDWARDTARVSALLME